jgi:hypothetical protein
MFSFRNYIIPVSLTSLVYTLPRYAELTVVETSEGKHDYFKKYIFIVLYVLCLHSTLKVHFYTAGSNTIPSTYLTLAANRRANNLTYATSMCT